jgi:ADP-heptose:LPS heptosyltransferase/GT2 family glycosyltransferase
MTASSAPAGASPARTLLCVKVDTLGDVILFAPTLRTVLDGAPGTRLVVLIRRTYAELAPLLAPGVEWMTTTLDPFANGPEEDPAELARVRSEVSGLAPDVVVAASSRHNWLETVIAATSGAARRIGVGAAAEDEFFSTRLRLRLGVDASAAFTEHVEARPDEPDWKRNFVIADVLLGRDVARQRPALGLPESAQMAARRALQQHGLEPGKYVVCAAAGFANVALKTWPAARFGAALAYLRERHDLPALLVGHESERTHLEAVAAGAGGATALWLGRDGTLAELAGLIADAGLFLGNDTGAMHLAAALDVPVVAVFGGGTWPRFVPAARRAISVVHPLPCFGCGWDCAFGDAPCMGEITVADVTGALDFALVNRDREFSEIRAVEHLPASTRVMMGKAAERYHEARRDHLARQHKLEELTDLDREKDAAIAEKEAAIFKAEADMRVKDAAILEKENEINTKQAEIDALRVVCSQREQLIITLDGNARALQTQAATVAADKALLEKTLEELPADHAHAVRTIAGQASHIRNLEALVQIRNQELAEARSTAANRAAGLHDLEQSKHYLKLLAEKEAVIRELDRTCRQRDAVIQQLMAESTSVGGKLWKMGQAIRAQTREKLGRPFDRWLYRAVVERYWMHIGVLRQYEPRPLAWDARLPRPKLRDADLPQIAIVTPSFGQEKFIERTLRSVLDQAYPKLLYVVQDGGSKDTSPAIIERYAPHLRHWESLKDNGQADAIARGFRHVAGALAADDIMAWLNSDDVLGPGVLRYVAEYFRTHPDTDVLYGHRIIVDEDDREVGRWVMPRHNPATLEWIDYVPQETLFWRKKAWDLVGGIDPTFQFALDWDLLARFQQAGCKTARVPYFLGAFRVHHEQKTSQAIHTVGAEEMRRIRTRFHGERQDNPAMINRHEREARFRGALAARLCAIGIRW